MRSGSRKGVIGDDAVSDAAGKCIGVDVIKDTFTIRVHVPVQSSGEVFHLASANIMVEQIEIRPSQGDFPSSDPPRTCSRLRLV